MSAETTEDAVRRLAEMTSDELMEEYRRAFAWSGQYLGAQFVRRRLAQRLQERAYGPLGMHESVFLERLARRDKHVNLMTKANSRIPLSPCGVTYVREYKGKVYEARATRYNQFEMGGKVYASLTACAKAITGQHTSGRRWFRLKGAL